jgi:adenylate kinase family enzyme
VQQLVSSQTWIIDGNYGGTLDLRLEACDTVVFLDLPRTLCLWRVLTRHLRHFGRTRPELPPGCRERLSWDFLTWIWTYPLRRRGGILKRLAELGQRKRVAILRSSAEVEQFLAGVPSART